MKFIRLFLALLLAVCASDAATLINLDSTALNAGPLSTWTNTGTHPGNFVTNGGLSPQVTNVSTGTGSVRAVTLSGSLNWYKGPQPPAALIGTSAPRTIEAWVYNPTVAAEETVVSWGRLGNDNANISLNYGSNANAAGGARHVGAADMTWATTPLAAKWHYLVYTYDGNTARLYVDGIESTSKAVALNTLITGTGTNPGSIMIGTQNAANTGVPASTGTAIASLSVARVRVKDELMTTGQIQSQYVTEGPTFGRGEPTIVSFTASSTNILPGQAVTLSWNTLGATSVSINQGIGTVASTGSIVVSPVAPTTYTITATANTVSSTASVTVTPQSAIALRNRWSFSNAAAAAANGAQVNDLVGTAHGFIRGTGATFTGTQISLPGGSSASAPYVDLPNGIMSSLSEMTIEGWMTLGAVQNWSRYFDFGTNTAGEINAPGGSFSGTEYLLLSASVGTNDAQRRFELRDNNVPQTVDLGDTTNYGTQFHFAVVYSATANGGSPLVSYYKNGTLIGTLATTYRLQDIADVNNWLGRSNWSPDNNTQGSYNEFRIWNGALPASAIADSVTSGPDSLPQAPRVDVFTALSPTIYAGDSVRLSYVTADPASLGVTGTINNGVGSITTPNGYVTVTPATTTTYTLTLSNSAGTRTATTTVTVLPSAPIAQNLAASTAFETPLGITLPVTDPNTPVGSLTYTILAGPTNGVLTGTGQTRTYTPNAGFSGTDVFTFKANDGANDSNVATVTVTVYAPPSAPTDIIPNDAVIRTDTAIGGFVARLRPVDPNPTDTFTLQLVSGTGDTHNSYFTISGLQLIAAHDFSGDLGQTISIRVRVTDNTGRSFDKVLTFPVQAPDLHVIINEINYNPAINTQISEFIELYNPTASSVNLSGWRFNSGIDYTFPFGTSIAAGGYLVVAKDPVTIQALYNVTALGPWSGGLTKFGEEIILRDSVGNKVDGVAYGITSPWPASPNGDGPSLELIHPTLDNDLGGHWRASNSAPTAVNYLTANSTGWSYRKGTSEASSPTNLWHGETFTLDGSWLTGQAPIGLYLKNSSTPLATNAETGVTLNTQLTDMASYSGSAAGSGTNFSVFYSSVFFRKTFSVSGSIPKQLLLRIMHNDAAIVWINGTEVGRFGFPITSAGEVPFNSSAYYERANDPWSEVVLANADALLHAGTNTIAIQGFAKAPYTRSQQEDLATYNVFDFSVDAELKNLPETMPTPGAQNSTFTTVNGPAIREIEHTPKKPTSTSPIVISAKISDPQGVGAVTLSYQIVTAGNYIPSTLPYTNAQILANPALPLAANPAFELPANWTTVAMVDDGSVSGDIPGDGKFTAIIPAQANRALVRYRINATDLTGQQTRVPSTDDPRKNFAAYVYDGVPTYINGANTFSPATLNTLPVYQWIMRSGDLTTLLAYNAADQFANTPDLNVLNARRYENFEGTLVVDDEVIDHTAIRLRGGNSRYNGTGKRHFRFIFPKGTPLTAADESGNKYPLPWTEMLFNKMFGNKGYYDFGLPYEVGGQMWRLAGLPIPESHWVHFRIVQNADASHSTLGDFWGLYQALEFPDGPNFLAARGLERGNFYKMSDWMQNGELATRSQAPGAVDFAEDFDNIRYNIHQTASQSFLEQYVNMPLFYRYDAIKEAIRHYDIFAEPTGRHRVKNLIWYFEPVVGNPLGRLWHMPYDWDASFGPNWNSGWDFIHNAIYDHFDIPDSPTWQLPKQTPRTAMSIDHRNAIREIRDLLFYRDVSNNRGPVDDIIDDALAKISQFYPADMARWPTPGAPVTYPGGAPTKAADMKAFCFTGWTDTAGNGDPAVGAGGRAAYLDTISDGVDVGVLPASPTITDTSSGTHPVDGITLQSSAFSDPQGAGDFAGIQWRIGEITDPAAPAYVATEPRIYEITDVWTTASAVFNANVAVPSNVLRVGHTYRARVRHKDLAGHWGHWSAPVQFTTSTSNYVQVLTENLHISEFMYKPLGQQSGEAPYIEGDFEYIELVNTSNALTLDISNVRFTKGVDFDFAGSTITSLAPGARVLVVKNIAAFNVRYGAGKPIAGAWSSTDSLNNGGEQLKLSYGAGTAIHDFTYNNAAPWPTQAALGGYPLILRAPETNPDYNVGTNWRTSYVLGGNPGSDDRLLYDTWATANTVVDPLGDDDGDGVSNLAEFALGGNPHSANRAILPVVASQSHTVLGVPGNYLTVTFTRPLGVENVGYTVEFTDNLASGPWTNDGVQVSTVDNPNGTRTEVWRSSTLQNSNTKQFARMKFLKP